MSRRAFALACLVLGLAFPCFATGEPATVPELVFDAAAGTEAEAAALAALPAERLTNLGARLGLTDLGAPIRVILAAEDSPLATRVPPWINGYAYGQVGVVVLLPDRVPRYPVSSLAEVLTHELAHVLIDRAAHGRPVPRWFHEGLAMSLDGRWGVGDWPRFGLALLSLDRLSLGAVERGFGGDQAAVARSYAASGAFVHFLERRHGAGLPQRVLARVAAGTSFDAAFLDAAGETLGAAQDAFWGTQSWWIRWLPIAASSATLWLLISLLAILAIVRRRQRDRRRHEVWELEEALAAAQTERRNLVLIHGGASGARRVVDDETGKSEWVN